MCLHDEQTLRLLFAGSPAIVLPSLRMIAEGAKAGRWYLAGVLTNPDKPKGRGGTSSSRNGGIEPTDVGREAALLAKEFAAQGRSAPAVLKPETLKAEAREAVAALRPDLLVCFAYGRIFGPRFMELFPLGGINVHPSLLPKYRGASPIQEAILRGDAETGISIQRIAAEMDSGDILAQETIPLNGTETAAALSETAAVQGAELLRAVLEKVAETGRAGLEGTPQQGEPSYCTIIGKNSGIIDWNRSAPEIRAQIRAYNPWPLARTGHKEQILNILEAAPYEGNGSASACPGNGGPSASPGTAALAGPTPCCANSINALDVSGACPGRVLGIDKKSGILVQTGAGVLAVSLLQYQTKKVLPWQAFINGARDFIGSDLGLFQQEQSSQ